jgi:hypothetical protein
MEEKSRYISFKGSRFFPYENNPLKYNKIFRNKYIQKKILNHLNLPTANLITTIGEGLEISNQKQLNLFLGLIEKDIVFKKINGTGGDGFLFISPRGENFLAGDKILSRTDIWNYVVGKARNFKRGYMIEEKITNTDPIQDIHPASLNSYRVIMIKTNDNKWHNPCCYLNIGRDRKQFDNGQISVFSDLSGKSSFAYDYTDSRLITHHPNTGKPLVGIHLDGYQQVVDLAFEASEKFHFMGSLGWDIAYTNKGPLILETNAWWNNYRLQIAMGKGIINDEIANGLNRKNILCKWDKTRMYPGIGKNSLIALMRRHISKRSIK